MDKLWIYLTVFVWFLTLCGLRHLLFISIWLDGDFTFRPNIPCYDKRIYVELFMFQLEISKQNLKDREAKFDKELRELRQDKTSLEIDNARLSKVNICFDHQQCHRAKAKSYTLVTLVLFNLATTNFCIKDKYDIFMLAWICLVILKHYCMITSS